MKFTSSNVKTLGVYLGNVDPAHHTFTNILRAISRSLRFWGRLPLSKLAKARAVEIYHVSKLWYAATFYTIPQDILTTLEQEIFDYIDKPFTTITVSQSECKKPLLDGGLNLIDFSSKATATKINWLMRLCTDPTLKLNLAIVTLL